jgi:hypothetical protein
MTTWDRVVRCAERWGVPVAVGAVEYRDTALRHAHGWRMGPTLDTWIRWPERLIVVEPHVFGRLDTPSSIKAQAIDLAHELAHCVAGEDPDEIDEVESPLFAIEHAIGKACGLRFPEQVSAWTLRTPDEAQEETSWERLTTREKALVMRRSREAAIAAGLLDRDLRMTYRRHST